MTASFRSRLSEFQQRFLRAFAARTSAFFLTGGAVLSGWVLGHRRTDDLDLFTVEDQAMSEGDRLVRATAAEIGAAVESVQSHPDFKRYLLRAGSESVVVDLVRERVPQLYPKVDRGGLLTDSAEEIMVNEICALVGRAEIRDVIDLYCLENTGLRVEDFLANAARKDGGVTAATLAWVLSSLNIPEGLPEGTDAAALRSFVRGLEQRMRRLAFPEPPR